MIDKSHISSTQVPMYGKCPEQMSETAVPRPSFVSATLLKTHALSVQVCVPETYTDEQITEFAEQEYPCGTERGWRIRREGDLALRGDPERNPCDRHASFVHVILDA